jgi:aerobic C4-dicarboxylate transport protein
LRGEIAVGDSGEPLPSVPKQAGRGLFLAVLFATAAGVLLGLFYPNVAVQLKPLGDLFIKIIKLIIPPVIFLTIVTGIGNAANIGALGRVVAKAFVYFTVLSLVALVLGLAAANLAQPGVGINANLSTFDLTAVKSYASSANDLTLLSFLRSLVPTSLVGTFVDGNILQVLVVSIIFGLGVALAGKRAQPLTLVLDAMSQAVFRMVDMLMNLAPLGALGAMAFTIGKFGIAALANLAGLVLLFYGTSLLFVFVILGLVASFAGFSIFRLCAFLKNELLVVLGTSSSESVLSPLMEKLEAAGCSRSVVGLVVPTGYSFNLDGTNIYLSLAAVFLAQALKIHLGWQQQLIIVGVGMISSKGAAGVTGAGFVALAATLSVVHDIPITSLALIFGVDRFMSQSRALTNFVGNAVATLVVGRWEGQLDRARLDDALGVKRRNTPTKEYEGSKLAA